MQQPRRVLIVEDRRAVRQGLQALIALWPEVVCVGEAVDGQEGLKLAALHRPDVVLMDVWMRGMDGLEATRRIKSQWPETRVIVLTLRAEFETDALAAGANAFLVKGGPPEALRAAICKTSTPGDGDGGQRLPHAGAPLRHDLSGLRAQAGLLLLRKNRERRAGTNPGMIPRSAGLALAKGLA